MTALTALVLGTLSTAAPAISMAGEAQDTQQSAAPNTTRQVGTVKAISGTTIKLTTDAGGEVTVQVADTTRMVRTAPGQKDLTAATPITLQDLQVGDRVLVRGKAADGGTLTAASIVAIKSGDIARKQAQEREDWQKRGVGGLVSTIDPGTGAVTITTNGSGGNKTVAVRTTRDTIVRRYAPDSVKFDDARKATVDEIKPGDQLRARGNRNADGTELTAEEIVSGSFRNIAGTVISVDLGKNAITVMDLATKKPVLVNVTAESQLRNLPAMIAQRIAMRLKATNPVATANGNHPPAGVPAEVAKNNGGNGNGRAGGPSDFQQILERMPQVSPADLKKGDAVMIVTTQGTATGATVITLLSGVEPILTASPNGSRAAMLLSPWNLGSGGDAE